MDILNPLYLKAQGLIRNSADPNSIVYLSIPNSKRDDKFLTVGVPIEKLAEVIGALTEVKTDGVTITGNGTLLDPLVASGGESEYTEDIINISSAQILSMGTNPIKLLPNLTDLNSYYVIDKIVIEGYQVTTSYDFSSGELVSLYFGGRAINIRPNDFNSGFENTKSAIVITGFGNPQSGATNGYDDDYNLYPIYYQGDSQLELSTYNLTNPRGGDGTMIIKIYYKVVSFFS